MAKNTKAQRGSGAKPTFTSSASRLDVTTPVERQNDKAFFLRVGTAWISKNGKGLSIELDAMPVNGRLYISEPLPKRENAGRGGGDNTDFPPDDPDADDDTGEEDND